MHDARPAPIYTVSVDEKPGVQALGTTAADLPPAAGKHASVGRNHEYVRHGTLSILAALDLHSGEIIANVELRHRSVEFIALLRRLDEHYPSEAVTRGRPAHSSCAALGASSGAGGGQREVQHREVHRINRAGQRDDRQACPLAARGLGRRCADKSVDIAHGGLSFLQCGGEPTAPR
jgi:hypothetical protein